MSHFRFQLIHCKSIYDNLLFLQLKTSNKIFVSDCILLNNTCVSTGRQRPQIHRNLRHHGILQASSPALRRATQAGDAGRPGAVQGAGGGFAAGAQQAAGVGPLGVSQDHRQQRHAGGRDPSGTLKNTDMKSSLNHPSWGGRAHNYFWQSQRHLISQRPYIHIVHVLWLLPLKVVRYPDLQRLSLSMLTEISDASLVSVARHCCSLTSLSLSYCPGISDRGLAQAAPYLHRLQHLHLSCCDNISDRWAEGLHARICRSADSSTSRLFAPSPGPCPRWCSTAAVCGRWTSRGARTSLRCPQTSSSHSCPSWKTCTASSLVGLIPPPLHFRTIATAPELEKLMDTLWFIA